MDQNWLLYTFYGILILLLLSGLLFSIQAFRGRISWGQARIMGISATLFIWIEIIFFLVIAESAFEIVSFIIDLPLWVDFLIFFIIFLLMGVIYFKLSRRANFKSALFIPMVLIPLGIPGINLVSKVTKVGCVEIIQKYGMYFVKSTPCKVAIWPQIKTTMIGKIKFNTSHIKGRLGDRLSAMRLTGMGYKKLNSKINSLHGIDGVYLKKANNGTITEILIAENKVDSSQLAYGKTKQMSDEWVINNATKMLNSKDTSLQQTGKLIIDTMKSNPTLIEKQLWTHNLESGYTTVKILDKNAKSTGTKYKWQDDMIAKELRRWCNKGKIECIQ